MEGILKFFKENIVDYLNDYLVIIIHPTKILLNKNDEQNISWKSLSFGIISIFIGLMLFNYKELKFEVQLISIISILVMWFIVSVLIFFVSKIFLGKSNYLEILNISLQSMSVLYVLCNTVFFFIRIILDGFIKFNFATIENQYYFEANSNYIYYLIFAVLSFAYLFLPLKKSNKFGFIRAILSHFLVLIIIISIGILFIISRSMPMGAPTK